MKTSILLSILAALLAIPPASAQSADTAVSMYARVSPGLTEGVDWPIRDVQQPSLRQVRGYRQARRAAVRAGGRGISLSGVASPLAAKAHEIASACGSVVISGYRRTRVRGTGHMSLHASGRAVDMRGNPGCIYSHLRGWEGGYTTDYGRVQHVHISWGGSEHGLRFAHGGHRHASHRHSRRYARA